VKRHEKRVTTRTSTTPVYLTCYGNPRQLRSGNPPSNFQSEDLRAPGYKTHRITIDSREPELLQTERPTLYDLCGQQGRLITQIKDAAGMKHDTQEAIMSILTSSIAGGYDDIPVDDYVEVLCSRIQHKLTDQQQAQPDRPITETELLQAILQGAVRRSPGADGIPLEFYRWGLEVIKTELLAVYNVMFHEEHITK
jgi:hypothetical protein